MPNSVAHQLAGLATGLGVYALDDKSHDVPAINPVTVAVTGAAVGKFPDILEPALHPNHRQFFHSVTVLVALGYGLKKLYDWKPESDGQLLLRGLLLIGGGAYASHLVMDSLSRNSLPLVGKL